ncbi:Fibronectin, type III [Beggiatoa sp. PS]|nr:Fibronectin, type III [Beggiatoa sp. PS]
MKIKRYLQLNLVPILLSTPLPLLAGTLNSPAAPTDAGSAMYTIEDIYNRLDTGAPATAPSGGFTEPTSGPGATGHTLTEVYNKADEAMNFVPTCLPPKTLNGTRWCDNGDGTVTDLTTGLIWLKDVSWGGLKKWDANGNDNAHVRAGTLKSGTAGLTDSSEVGDWRLPTKNELVGIATGTESVYPSNMRAFSGIQSGYYWSSTTDANDTTSAWRVDFPTGGGGSIGPGTKTNSYSMWPVRGGK